MGLNEAQDLDLARSKGVLTYTNYSILSSRSVFRNKYIPRLIYDGSGNPHLRSVQHYVTGMRVNQWTFKIFELSLATEGQEVHRGSRSLTTLFGRGISHYPVAISANKVDVTGEFRPKRLSKPPSRLIH
jgi:hypothetical protein